MSQKRNGDNFDEITKDPVSEKEKEFRKITVTGGHTNPAYVKEPVATKGPSPSSSIDDDSFNSEKDPPQYEDVVGKDEVLPAKPNYATEHSEQDEKILNVLREVVRKCTNANPMKRPTAKEVLMMLEPVAPPELLADKSIGFD